MSKNLHTFITVKNKYPFNPYRMHTTTISAAELAAQLHNPHWRIVDCRSQLADTAAGRLAYNQAHILGAVFAHLEEDLSGPIVPGTTGRHPLPCVTATTRLLGKLGIGPDTQVVVYDDSRGAIAARLWWMLQYMGHAAVAVLDGGYTHWIRSGYAVDAAVPEIAPTTFVPHVQSDWLLTADAVDQWRQLPDHAVVDSREAPRYRGEVEPIDPVAGHIAGAINLPFADNWRTDGLLHDPETLRQRFSALPPPERTVFYCGSGVTACHNILAYRHAGLGTARLYAGSWSEWITDSQRAIGPTQ